MHTHGAHLRLVTLPKTLRKDFARRFVDSRGQQASYNGGKEMLIIYEPAVIKFIVKVLTPSPIPEQSSITRSPSRGGEGSSYKKQKVKVYVFSDGQYAYDDDFREVIDRVELCALPAAILNAYQRVLPRRKERPLAQPGIANPLEQETEIPAEWTEGMIED